MNISDNTGFNTDVDYDEEISLSDLFRFILCKWKRMILFIVLFILLFCGYKTASYTISRSGYPSEYSTALKAYNTQLKEYQNKIDEYNDTINDYNNQLNAATNADQKAEILNSITSTQQSRDSLTAPEKPKVLTNELTVSGYLKMGLAGAFIGMIVYCVLRTIKYVTDGKIHDGNELVHLYHLRKLDDLSKNNKKKTLKENESDDTSSYAMITALIENLNNNNQPVAVVGTVSENALKTQGTRLNQFETKFEYVPISKVNEEPSHYKALSSFNYALLIVKRDSTRLRDTEELMNCLAIADTHILGYLVI